MSKVFSVDNPVMRVLSRIGDIIILNVITLILCVPVVTAGAAFTALHTVTQKMRRNEEGYILQNYFAAFRDNFKQATIIWLFFMVIIFILGGDYVIWTKTDITFPTYIKVAMGILNFLALMEFVYIYPVLARFDNTVRNTFKNAFMMGLYSFPKTLAMMILTVIPWVVLYFIHWAFWFCVLFGLALPAFINTYIYSTVFQKIEAKTAEDAEENIPETEEPEDNPEMSEPLEMKNLNESEE